MTRVAATKAVRNRPAGAHWAGAVVLGSVLWVSSSPSVFAQERPYFITYNQEMEEPGSLEFALNPVLGTQRDAGGFVAGWSELEYGVTGWWTSELYFAGQSTRRDGAVFTGFRFENRLRPLPGEHRVNPVLYVEYENVNEADKTMLEVVGHDVEADHARANDESRLETQHEIEAKLILSGYLGGWNLSGNLITEKDLSNAPWELGYAMGISRPLALAARPDACTFCRENFTAGVEVYGGLATFHDLGFTDTSHYVAALLAWDLPNGVGLRLSPTVGLNGNSHRFLLRFGISYEIPAAGRRMKQLFRGGRP